MASRDPKVIEVPSPAALDSSPNAAREQKNNQLSEDRHPEPQIEESAAGNDQTLCGLELSHWRLLEAVKQRMLLLDIDTGRINDVNSVLVQLLGFFPTEIVGKTVRDLAPLRRFEANQAVVEYLLHKDSSGEKHSGEKETGETGFSFDETAVREKLEGEIAQIQRHSVCLCHARWIMAALTAIGVAGFGYLAILLEGFPDRAQQVILNLFCALGAGSLFSLFAFALLGMICRKKLDNRRLQYYQVVARLLKAHFSKPI